MGSRHRILQSTGDEADKMQSSIRIAVSLLLLSSAFAGSHRSAKLRRDGVLNLYPFPRVGRSGPQSITHYQLPDNDLFLEYDPIEKRLISFPRVGRASIPSPARRAEHTPMWFGPRVGRSEHYQQMRSAEQLGMRYGPRAGQSFKNDDEDVAIQNDPNASEPEQIEPTREE